VCIEDAPDLQSDLRNSNLALLPYSHAPDAPNSVIRWAMSDHGHEQYRCPM